TSTRLDRALGICEPIAPYPVALVHLCFAGVPAQPGPRSGPRFALGPGSAMHHARGISRPTRWVAEGPCCIAPGTRTRAPADRRDVRSIPIARDYALIVVDQRNVVGRTLVAPK